MGKAGVSGFYSGKMVFITGHTGFKGTWLCALLMHLGAEVTGYALEPPTEPSLFALSGMQDRIQSVYGDIRDLGKLEAAMQKAMEHVRMTRRSDGDTATAADADMPDFITVRADHRLYKLNFGDILYIEGQHEYVTFHTLQRKVTAYYSLKTLEEQLPSARFVRIHKSYMVSLDHIDMADSKTVSVHGRKLPVGSSYKETLWNKLRLK